MNSTLTNCIVIIIFCNICLNTIAAPLGNWAMFEEDLRQQLLPYRRDQRLQSDKSVIESLVRSRQNQLRAADRIRFRRNGLDESSDVGKNDLESALKLRERLMRASDGIRFRKRDINSYNH